MQSRLGGPDLGVEKRINELGVAGELSARMAEIADMVRGGCDIKHTVYKLRSKEGKNTSFVVDFVRAYLEGIADAKIASYKECRMIDMASPGECSCVFPAPSEKHKKEVEDMRCILGFLKNAQNEESYKKTFALSRLW